MPRSAVSIVLVAATLSLALAACDSTGQGSGTDATADDAGAATTTTSTAEGPAPVMVVGTVGGEVRVVDDRGTTIASAVPDTGDAYRQPVWASDGSILASFASVESGPGLVALDPVDGGVVWTSPMETPPFFYLPAPAPSTDATTSLRNDPSGNGLVSELVDRSGNARVIATVSPFYASWSPDGDQLAIHGEGRYVDIRDASGTRTIAEPSGAFQAPAWDDEGLVTLRTTDAAGQVLSVWNGEGFRDVAAVEGPARFSVASGRVAIQSIAQDDAGGLQAGVPIQELDAVPGGRLVVIDLDTGAVDTVSSVLTPMFQWDPSGQRLLFATFDSESELEFTWRVWEDGTVTDGASFAAQPVWFRDVAPFFDQYVQSVSLWAPDGSAYAYPEVVDARPVVSIQPLDGSPPSVVENATWVSWLVPGG